MGFGITAQRQAGIGYCFAFEATLVTKHLREFSLRLNNVAITPFDVGSGTLRRWKRFIVRADEELSAFLELEEQVPPLRVRAWPSLKFRRITLAICAPRRTRVSLGRGRNATVTKLLLRRSRVYARSVGSRILTSGSESSPRPKPIEKNS